MLETGNYVVIGIGNWFWANVNVKGCLIKGLTHEEKSAIVRLHKADMIKKETKYIIYGR